MTSNISAIFGKHEKNTLVQLEDVASRATKVALMADGHQGYVMPIGGVAAYDNQVSVVGVGFDIACGNAAIKTDMHVTDLGKSEKKLSMMLNRIADDIAKTVSFGIGRNNLANDAPTDAPLFDSVEWLRLRERAGHGNMRQLKDKARQQLGTVGSGNHYVDVFRDEEGFLWVGVHFGSRGFGHGIASGFLAQGQGMFWGDHVPEVEVLLSLYSDMGKDYWALMELAGQYAYTGREWVARKVVSILGAKETDLVHNHHNFAWKEIHDGKEMVVVRKGATPAFPGQLGFVGGSMGDDSVILRGAFPYISDKIVAADEELQRNALFSTVHGAGRVMGRQDAKKGRAIRDSEGKPTGERDVASRITPEMQDEWLKSKNVILRGGGVDESPQVYRRLTDVLTAQGPTIEVLRTLTPLIVVMAGKDIRDPYKD